MEENKLIAEFMGISFNVNEFQGVSEYEWMTVQANCRYWDERDGDFDLDPWRFIRFASSWDWIMPVVEKIENLTIKGKDDTDDDRFQDVEWNFSVEIQNSQCMIHRNVSPQYHGTEDDFLKLYDCRNTTKIESTHRAVLAFIKWHNKNNQSSQ